MSTAKKTVYAVIGVGSKAIDGAKALPKKAAALPGIVTGTAQTVAGKTHAVAGKAASLPDLVRGAGSLITKLPKRAATLPGRAAGKARSLAGEAVKDAHKRWENYADRGRKVLSQNGSGKTAAKKPAKPKGSKASKVSTEAPPVPSPTPAVGTTPQIL